MKLGTSKRVSIKSFQINVDLWAFRDFIAAAKLTALAHDASGVGTSARPQIKSSNTVFAMWAFLYLFVLLIVCLYANFRLSLLGFFWSTQLEAKQIVALDELVL